MQSAVACVAWGGEPLQQPATQLKYHNREKPQAARATGGMLPPYILHFIRSSDENKNVYTRERDDKRRIDNYTEGPLYPS